MGKLEQAFREMMERSFPDDTLDSVGIDQINDMRRAFMGGAMSAVSLAYTGQVTGEELADELIQFHKAVENGQA